MIQDLHSFVINQECPSHVEYVCINNVKMLDDWTDVSVM